MYRHPVCHRRSCPGPVLVYCHQCPADSHRGACNGYRLRFQDHLLHRFLHACYAGARRDGDPAQRPRRLLLHSGEGADPDIRRCPRGFGHRSGPASRRQHGRYGHRSPDGEQVLAYLSQYHLPGDRLTDLRPAIAASRQELFRYVLRTGGAGSLLDDDRYGGGRKAQFLPAAGLLGALSGDCGPYHHQYGPRRDHSQGPGLVHQERQECTSDTHQPEGAPFPY